MKKIFLILFTISLLAFSKTSHVNAQTGCSVTPPTNTGRINHILTDSTTTAGTYRVWSRMKAADTTNNSFYLQIDSNCPVLVQSPSTSFVWVASPNNVTLTAGVHDITVIGNQPGVGVDKILMTKNLTCIPDNTIPAAPNNFAGTNCPAEIIVTPTVAATDTTPPVISNIYAFNVTPTSASIHWNLDEQGSGQINYGTTVAYGQNSGFQSCCQYNYHEQPLTGLTSGTSYHYRVRSTNAANLESISADCIFIAGGAATQPCSSTSVTPIPTSTPIPTAAPTNTPVPTPAPNSTILNFPTLKLHGVGKGGDNTGSAISNYPAPLSNQSSVTADIIDENGNQIASAVGTFTYSPTLGYYNGNIVLPTTINDGYYLVKVKTPKYLRRQVPGIIKITKGQINQIPAVSLIAGDINNDNSLNMVDYSVISDCYSDFAPAKNCSDPVKKASADIFQDNKVDNNDYSLFILELSTVKGD